MTDRPEFEKAVDWLNGWWRAPNNLDAFLKLPNLRELLEETGRIRKKVDMYHYRTGEYDFVDGELDS